MSGPIAIFLRHGDYHQIPDTPSAHQPFPLTEHGFEQAFEAVPLILEMVNSNNWTLDPVVYSSQMLRAWQTASLICEGIENLEQVTCHDDLAERGVGSVANMAIEQIEQMLFVDPRYEDPPEGWKSNSHYCLPFQGAESLMMAGQRVADFITSQTSDLGSNSARVFVGHGASFRHAAHIKGVLEFDEIAKLSMYHAVPLAFQMTEAGVWRHVAGDWKVRGDKDIVMD